MIIVGKLNIMLRDMQMREGGLAGEISERSNYSLRNFLMLFVLRFYGVCTAAVNKRPEALK